jgi:hypothetical protein
VSPALVAELQAAQSALSGAYQVMAGAAGARGLPGDGAVGPNGSMPQGAAMSSMQGMAMPVPANDAQAAEVARLELEPALGQPPPGGLAPPSPAIVRDPECGGAVREREIGRTGLQQLARGLVARNREAAIQREAGGPASATSRYARHPLRRWMLAGGIASGLAALAGGALVLEPGLREELLGATGASAEHVVASASVAQQRSRPVTPKTAGQGPAGAPTPPAAGAEALATEAIKEALKNGTAPVKPGGASATTTAPAVQTAAVGAASAGAAAIGAPPGAASIAGSPAADPAAPQAAAAVGAPPDAPALELSGGQLKLSDPAAQARLQLRLAIENGRDAVKNYDFALATQQFEAAREIARDLQDQETLSWLRAQIGRCYLQRGELIMRETVVTWQDCQLAREYFLKAAQLGFNGERNLFNIRSAERCTNRRPPDNLLKR